MSVSLLGIIIALVSLCTRLRTPGKAGNYLFEGHDKYKLLDAVDEKASGPVPHTILVAPGGKVLYRKSGSCEPLAIKRSIVDYLGRTYK